MGGSWGADGQKVGFLWENGDNSAEKYKKHIFGAHWGMWRAGIEQGARGKLAGNGGKWGEMLVDGLTSMWYMYLYMYLCVVQLSTVYIHSTSSA